MTAAAPRLAPYAALSASYFAYIGFFNPYLPLWLKELGYGIFAISLFTALQAATRLFAPYLWGWWADHSGQRVRLLRATALVAFVSSLGLAFEPGWLALGLLLFVMFTHNSAMMPMAEAALAQLVSSGGSFDAGRYGRVRLWGSLGFLFSVFAAGAWFDHFGLEHFTAWTWATLLALLLSACWLPGAREPALAHDEVRAPIGPVLRSAPVRWLFGSVFFHVLAHMGIYIYLSLYLDQLGYGKTAIGLLWAVSVATEIIWFYTQARWLPRLSLPGWLLLAAAVTLARMALTASLGGGWGWMLLAQALHAITFAAHHTVCIALVSRHFPGGLRARGQALYSVLGYGLSGVFGGLAGAWLSSYWGLATIFWCSAGVALLAMACAARVAWLARGAAQEPGGTT